MRLPRSSVSRRDAARLLAVGATLPWLSGCVATAARGEVEPGRLTSRPRRPTATMPHGTQEHPIGRSSAVLHVPSTVNQNAAVGLMLFLHGANRGVDGLVAGHRQMLDDHNVIMVAPYAADGGTWDLVMGLGFFIDPLVVDASLALVYRHWTIDPRRIVIAGFSDGATYSLALGRANGDLWKRIVAYAPARLIEIEHPIGRPSVLITHGTRDSILPVENTRNETVPGLRARGYTVEYREFDGDHAVPSSAARDVVESIGQPPT